LGEPLLKVIAFIGKSGSGKSYRAISVAKNNNIGYIIDDGLLIRGNKIIAGSSAKKEKTIIASIKRAIFSDESHKNAVKDVISKEKIEKILILGTSIKMIQKIIKALELPQISEVIHISNIASEEEIKKATNIRKKQGKHVIPVPTFEIKKDFSGYFIDSLRIFDFKGKGRKKLLADKSIVRPTFSYLGEYYIYDRVIHSICKHEISKFTGINSIGEINIINKSTGIIIEIPLIINYGENIVQLGKKVQYKLKDIIEHLTSLNVVAINVHVKSLIR
jgi:uncharacterized alkaline shock family protein YloU